MTWNDLVQMFYDPTYAFWLTMPKWAQVVALIMMIAVFSAVVKMFEKFWNWATD